MPRRAPRVLPSDGTLWTNNPSGVLYSWNTGQTAWTNRGQVPLSSGQSWINLSFGARAFDGNGTAWFITSGSRSSANAFPFTISAAELAETIGAKAAPVGELGADSVPVEGIVLLLLVLAGLVVGAIRRRSARN